MLPVLNGQGRSVPHAQQAQDGVEFCQMAELLKGVCCPITHEIFIDPVMCADGHTYERAALARWLRESMTSPVTGLPLATAHVVTNHALRCLVDELKTRWCQVGCGALPAFINCPRSIGDSASLSPQQAGYMAKGEHSHGQSRPTPFSLLLRLLMVAVAFTLFRLPDLDVVIALATRGGDSGAAFVLLCCALVIGLGIGQETEGLGVLALLAGPPLAALSFCSGMVSAMGGASTGELLLVRALLMVGVAFCIVGLYFSQGWLRASLRPSTPFAFGDEPISRAATQ